MAALLLSQIFAQRAALAKKLSRGSLIRGNSRILAATWRDTRRKLTHDVSTPLRIRIMTPLCFVRQRNCASRWKCFFPGFLLFVFYFELEFESKFKFPVEFQFELWINLREARWFMKKANLLLEPYIITRSHYAMTCRKIFPEKIQSNVPRTFQHATKCN